MEYADFGKTGRKVSRLGFGGAPLGLKNYLHDYDPADPKHRAEGVRAVERALELGVTYFDSAQGYGAGQSEAIMGEALRHADPKKIFVATKIGSNFKPGTARAGVEQSLERLKVPALDLLQFHGSSYTDEHARRILEPGGLLDELVDLKRQGLVRAVGFTTEDNNRAVYDFIDDPRFEAMQLCYNLFFQHPYDPNRPFGSLFEADKRGLGISAMRPTTSGLFSKWMKMARPGDDFDYTPALLKFAFSNPLVDVVLVGMRSARRVEQNVEILEDVSGRIDILDLYKYYV